MDIVGNQMLTLPILLGILLSLLCLVSSKTFPYPHNVEEELHQLLTKKEKESLFGNENAFHYEAAQVSWKRIRKRRSFEIINENYHLVATISTRNKTLNLHMQQHTEIISPNFKMIIRHHNFTEEILPHEMSFPQCLYHGKIVGGGEGVAALSLCGKKGMTGLIILSGKHYILQPLPRRLANNYGIETHVIYEKSREQICGGNDLIPPPPDPWEQEEANTISDGPYDKRDKRATKRTKIIETAVFVDDEMYKKIDEDFDSKPEDAIREIVFTMINAVQLLYNQPTLGVEFKIILVKMDIIKHSSRGPNKSKGDIKNYLTNFCKWETQHNPRSDKNDDHWDHAIMLSGLNLYQDDPKNHKVIGLAWVSGMCRRNYSCSINEGKTFESVFVITHEMGHNLGMHHDGSQNSCSQDDHIMSPSLGPGKITWSTCSRDYLKEFLNGRRIVCLDDSHSVKSALNHNATGLLPGLRFSIKEQCQMAFGTEYQPYTTKRKPFDNICRELWCYYGSHAKRAHPALDGSLCQKNKLCMYGECIYHESAAAFSNNQKGREWSSSTTESTGVFTKMKNKFDELATKLKNVFG